ncbi:MAG: Crp/Fnr family transcriptional regulator [Proteobacteria bacterium]|nr:Crp/Fnr family transcriptional regulator [Pseudomonadota bacterium]
MRLSCRACAIRSRALCNALPEATLENLNRISRRRKIAAGRSLFGADEASSIVATVLSGVAKVSVSLPDGRTQVVGLHFPSDFIGRPFAGGIAPLTEAATDIEVCCFERTRFEGLLAEHRNLEEAFVKRLTQDLDAAREWMLLLGNKTAEERVASFLLLCARRLEPADCCGSERNASMRFDLPLSRTEIAQFLGLTIETVSRMLRRLSTEGVLNILSGRGIEIHDLLELESRAECVRA